MTAEVEQPCTILRTGVVPGPVRLRVARADEVYHLVAARRQQLRDQSLWQRHQRVSAHMKHGAGRSSAPASAACQAGVPIRAA